ncbi:TPA: methyl-accepting chemotaxis protein [Vibrio vulnificus]|uniref:methyl-accepting chemotaxis protein n=1 Tax=Vibrio vulnificus TaxID=672 RepID=UPI0007EE7FD7|nr:methyl-accepting chemotaxis protein [Vibrio vulnificus]ANN26730.1 N-acetylglucosamine regulated methyl-accepting chemotaxis protein [Vibrio vulnificus]MCU8346413.1 methyl-accepting chemotaxis protein [Vibrio vulnificus]HAS6040559.1 methyl-accepting chemotaxis protein [Vibrio vulnificus]HAS6044655.1 methyl-accepting chemotaxis protein [Vibrio vulnificus]HAS6059160.1 methyl-accepting chemotaxis protein [Vibrio vulnificus]
MKEIPFRWIDKYLIHLKIQEKFYLLFLLPLIALLILTLVLDNAADAMLNHLYQDELILMKNFIEAGNLSRSQVMDILASSNTIALGSGAGSVSVLNGSFNLVATHEQDLWTALSSVHWTIISVSLFIVALAVYYIMTFIGGAMFTMNKALSTLANGDLTARMNFFQVRDEFSTIAITIDKVAEREQKMVLSIQESVALMQQISSDLNQSICSSSDISNSQQEHLNSLASATEQMASTIREVANLAHDSSTQTEDARSVAQSGQVKVANTLISISQLSSEIQSASQAVEELDANAAQIDEVVTTINGISEQTNLLALNAAIEAARAGEQGRGFAVVADEVRALAGRTQQATVEIQAMIEALQRNSQSLTKLMEVTVNNANQGQTLMSEVNHEIASLADKNQTISDSSTQIATAAEEQGVVADNIAASVEEIRMQSNNVCEMINMTSRNVEQLRNQSDAMESLLTGLKA